MSNKPSKSGVTKEVKKEIQGLVQRSQKATVAGDYFLVRQINREIMELAGGGDAASAARYQNERLDFDPFLLKFAFGVVTLYGLGWVLAFFH